MSVFTLMTAFTDCIGSVLIAELISRSEAIGIWSFYASIFPENQAGIRLHEKFGLRMIDYRIENS